MKKYICIQICPELDGDNLPHCSITEETLNEIRFSDFCPCGNLEKWEEIKESHK